jgi:DNA topoisomerase I
MVSDLYAPVPIVPTSPVASFSNALKNIGRGLYQKTAKFAGYRAAFQTNTTTVGGRVGSNMNSTAAQLQRSAMNWTAEDVFKNSCIASAYIGARTNYCSSQMTYIPATGDPGLDKELREYLQGDDGHGGVFSTMGVDCSMQDAFSRTADLETPIRGDAVMIWYDDGEGLRLMEASADQIGEPYQYTLPRLCSLRRLSNGTWEEAAGTDLVYYCGRFFRGPDCVAYRIYERTNSWYALPTIYMAYDVIYFRDPSSFRGIRGMTKFATALPHMEKGEALFQTGMDAAQRQARTALKIQNNMGGPISGASVYTDEGGIYEDGQITYRERIPNGPLTEYYYTGDTAEFCSPDSPGPELIAGVETSDERVAIALWLNYAFLISCTKVGGAPSRLEIEKAEKEFTRIQTKIHRPRLKRISNTVILDAVRRVVFSNKPNITRGRWMLPLPPSVDAFYDAKENIAMKREGLEAPQDIIAETNRDADDVIRKKKEWAIKVSIAAEDANRELIKLGYKPNVTTADIGVISDNPQQGAAAQNLEQGKTATGDPDSGKTAKMALALLAEAHDVTGENRDDSGKWSSGGGSGSKALVPTKRVGEGKESKLVHPDNGAELPEHIKALKLPLAWTDVKINPDSKADLLAQGKDAKGRLQSVYSDSHNMRTAAAKFSRIRELLTKRDKIFAQNSANLQSADANTKENAAVSQLIHSTGIRPGSDSDTGAKKKAYGATTLQGQHVTQDKDGNVVLKFTGKKGVDLSIPITDSQVATMLLERKKAAGDTGKLFNTDDSKLRDYTHTLDGGGFKTKDFRTLKGTSTAIDQIKALPSPKNEKEYKAAVKKVATAVSQKLGNTPAIALQAYIDPTVFSGWQGWRQAA